MNMYKYGISMISCSKKMPPTNQSGGFLENFGDFPARHVTDTPQTYLGHKHVDSHHKCMMYPYVSHICP